MRLTVGPLPSAVYWRRRAVVLGALFIVLIVLFTTCGGPDNSNASKTGATPSPTGGSPEPSPSVLTPEASGSATAAPTTPAADPDPTTAATSAAAPPAGDGACTDAELKVTPVPSLTTAPAGQTIVIRLRIKNESDRTCTRDVGPDSQEIYIKQGARTIWSSDKCGLYKGSDPRSFTPNFEREYTATWNGQMSSSCSGANANGGAPAPGQYEVFGRVGTDNSAPVKMTLT